MDSDERFQDEGNGTISDRWTGLMWQEEYAYPETGSYISWYEANEYIARLNEKALGGYSDWRLPARLEIQSIYEPEYILPFRGKNIVLHINPIFEFSYGSRFWTCQTKLSGALGFAFDIGDMDWFPQGSISGTVRAVRLKMDKIKLLQPH